MRLPLMPPIAPMLAKSVRPCPTGGRIFEPKWDGFRSIIFRDGEEVEIGSRNGKPMTRYFPELVEALKAKLPPRCVVDGEIILVAASGDRLDFDALQQRIHPAASRVRLSAPPGSYADPLAALVPDVTPGLATLAGVHLEGPWLSSAYPGAHELAALRPPSTAELAAFLAPGTVRVVTLAPELTGGPAAIERLTAAGVRVAIGHSNADEAGVHAALAAGATFGTHLFNAMRPFHHRDPGAAGRCSTTRAR